MPRSKFHLNATQLTVVEHALAETSCPRIRRRATALKLIHEGHTPRQIAQIFGLTAQTVEIWFRRYRRFGVNGLGDKHRSGRPPKTDKTYHDTLEVILAETPFDMGFEDAPGWTVSLLRECMERHTGVNLSDRRMRSRLHQLGYRYLEVPSLLSQMLPPFPRDFDDQRVWFDMQDALRERLPASQTLSVKTWVKVEGEGDE